MKLLIVTQAVDKKHSALGFFHRWIEEFAKHCAVVHVICLEAGEHALPSHVHVHSLGKEHARASSLKYTFRLLRLSWQLRKEYDCVFVHMNPEYVLAGAPVWLLARKPVSLWYTHGSVSLALKLATYFVTNIFTAAKEGMNLSSSKVVVTGHGIDAPEHLPPTERDLDLITVGRISRSKNLEDLFEVLVLLRQERPKCTLTIIGAPQDADGQAYLDELKSLVTQKQLDEAVHWVGAVKHETIPAWLRRAKVFVHTAKNGSLDKVLLEALMTGTPVLTTSAGARSLPLGAWQVDSIGSMPAEIEDIYHSWPEAKLAELRKFVEEHHSLSSLVVKIYSKLQ